MFVIALLSGPFPELAAVMELGFRLVTGWLSYLFKTLPGLRLDTMQALYAALGFCLACLTMHLILRTFRAQQNQKNGPRWRHSVWMAVGVSIALGLGAMTGEIVDQVASFPKGNWLQERWSERAFVVLNKGRAKYLVEEIRAAGENEGRLPLRFFGVWGKDRAEEAANMVAFRTADPTALTELWIYLGGTNLNSAANVPVLAAPRPDKNGKRLVAFLDATVTECTEEEWQAALERWRQAMKGGEEQKVTEVAR